MKEYLWQVQNKATSLTNNWTSEIWINTTLILDLNTFWLQVPWEAMKIVERMTPQNFSASNRRFKAKREKKKDAHMRRGKLTGRKKCNCRLSVVKWSDWRDKRHERKQQQRTRELKREYETWNLKKAFDNPRSIFISVSLSNFSLSLPFLLQSCSLQCNV